MMKLVSRLSPEYSREYETTGICLDEWLEDIDFVSPNAADLVWGKQSEGLFNIEADKKEFRHVSPAADAQGILHWKCSNISKDKVRIIPADAIERTCVLMNTSMIDEGWVQPSLRKRIHADDEVCVLAFSFFDDTKNLSDWNKQYKKGQGIWYRSNTDVFFPYGLKEKQIHWVNYFTDSIEAMKSAIANSNILLLPGGAPDLLMKRMREKKLLPLVKRFRGLVIGYSAGAMAQLAQYHITPDEDYPEFSWQKGLGYLSGFDIEVHYRNSSHQNRYIERAIEEKGMTVYAIEEKGGMIVDEKGEISFFGRVHTHEA